MIDDILEKKPAILLTEFDRYGMEYDELAAGIRQNAQIVICVTAKGLKPVRSRLMKPALNRAVV